MARRLGALHEALLRAGDAELARQAAEEVAAMFDHGLARIARDLDVLLWMVGVSLALTLANLWLVFTIHSRLPR